MAEPVATRVNEETKQWLENRAEQEDITVSKMVADILEANTGQLDDAEPDSIETRLNEIEARISQRLIDIENDIDKLTRRSTQLEIEQLSIAEMANGVYCPEDATYPPLPGEDEPSRHDDGSTPLVQ